MNKFSCHDNLNYSLENAEDIKLNASYKEKQWQYDNPPTPYDEKSCLIGNNITFSLNKNDSEIKADIVVSYKNSVRIWGQVKYCNGTAVPFAYVKLLKEVNNELLGIAHTITDSQGFYQFDICTCKNYSNFIVIVGKAAVSKE